MTALAVCGSLLVPAIAHAAVAPPPNDDLERRDVVTSYPYDVSTVTDAATDEVGEPRPCGGIGGTVWTALRASFTGRMSVQTTGLATTIDSVLAVYRGPEGATMSDLELVDCNDNRDFGMTQSEIVFPVTAGEIYYVQAGGADGARGSIRVAIRPASGHTEDGPVPDPDLPTGATSVVLDNGRLKLGVNDTGNLVARDSNVGLVFKATDNDALSPGCPCEGWGIVDEVSNVHAGVSESGWPQRTGDLRPLPFKVNLPAEAVSSVMVGDHMKVTHKFRPALGHPNLFEIVVTVSNLGEGTLLPLYRRTMDWDIGPTEFAEYVTIAGDVGGERGTEPKVIYTSNDGFARPDPSYGRSNLGQEGTFTDVGPDDHGALVDIAIPRLQPGQSSVFSIFYGAAARADEMVAELVSAQTAVYSLGKPSSPDGLELGSPNTFGFGFRLHDSRYVAMGDSFQSGEGAPAYEDGTDVAGVNTCHRSVDAYARRLTAHPEVVGGRLSFTACSGAVIVDLSNRATSTEGPPWNEGAQLDELGGDTTLVTLGIGGNDMEFAATLKTCLARWALQKLGARPCSETEQETFDLLLREISRPDPDTGLSRLQTLYREIRARAPRARVVVLGYPRFFTPEGHENCGATRLVDQLWINRNIYLFNEVIGEHVRSEGMEYRDMYTVGAGHELCADGPQFMNGVDPVNTEHSYHPNNFGHELIADRLLTGLRSSKPSLLYTVTPEQRVHTGQNVPEGTRRLDVSATWPGSDVLLSLQSPSGVIHRRAEVPAGVQHSNGPTHETFSVLNPEPGQWLVRMFGADVDDAGEPVELTMSTTAAPNLPPTAAITQTVSGSTVTLDATSSSDPDGTIAGYRWDFADGTSATGARVTHTYTESGTYSPAVIVTDDKGLTGFATAPVVTVELARYGFSGFHPPVESEEVNVVNAGRSVPFKWTLALADGTAETALAAVTSYGFDAEGATYSLRYDESDQQYVLVVSTPSSWAGQQRTFTLQLDDGTSHTAVFRLR